MINKLTRAWSAKQDDELIHSLSKNDQSTATKQINTRLQSLTQAIEAISQDFRFSANATTQIAEMLLLSDVLPSEKHQHYLQSIAHRGLYQSRIICLLEDIFKIETGIFEMQFGQVDLKKVVDTVIENALKISQDTNINLESQMPQDLPLILGDEYRIAKILESFILNARFGNIEFVENIETQKISIALTQNEGWVIIEINDNGDGLSAEFSETWTRYGFAQSLGASSVGRFEQAVSEYVISKHNGKLSVDYKEGQGTEVTIKLPVIQAKA